MIIYWRIAVSGNIAEIRSRFCGLHEWRFYIENLKKATFNANWAFKDKNIQANIVGEPEYVEIKGEIYFEDSIVASRNLNIGIVEQKIISITNELVDELNRYYAEKEVYDGLIPKLSHVSFKELENSWWVKK